MGLRSGAFVDLWGPKTEYTNFISCLGKKSRQQVNQQIETNEKQETMNPE